jgi:hypothetical protein
MGRSTGASRTAGGASVRSLRKMLGASKPGSVSATSGGRGSKFVFPLACLHRTFRSTTVLQTQHSSRRARLNPSKIGPLDASVQRADSTPPFPVSAIFSDSPPHAALLDGPARPAHSDPLYDLSQVIRGVRSPAEAHYERYISSMRFTTSSCSIKSPLRAEARPLLNGRQSGRCGTRLSNVPCRDYPSRIT